MTKNHVIDLSIYRYNINFGPTCGNQPIHNINAAKKRLYVLFCCRLPDGLCAFFDVFLIGFQGRKWTEVPFIFLFIRNNLHLHSKQSGAAYSNFWRFLFFPFLESAPKGNIFSLMLAFDIFVWILRRGQALLAAPDIGKQIKHSFVHSPFTRYSQKIFAQPPFLGVNGRGGAEGAYQCIKNFLIFPEIRYRLFKKKNCEMGNDCCSIKYSWLFRKYTL